MLFDDEPRATLADAATGALPAPAPGMVTTPVYETYWRFAAERQAVFMRRARGAPYPWTDDPILREWKFTNAYRASDRTSQYLIAHVSEGTGLSTDPREVFFRTVLFKLFNKAETWALLERRFGTPDTENFDTRTYGTTLGAARAAGQALYSAAYIMPSPDMSFERKHENHLRLIEWMLDRALPEHCADAKTLGEGYTLLRECPSIGAFLAYQLATDLAYAGAFDWRESEFTTPGPGAKDGIARCFSETGGRSGADIIEMLVDEQERTFEHLGLDFEPLGPRTLQHIDCQNLLCEVDKYARVAHRDTNAHARRSRIKQRFRPRRTHEPLHYPAKWGIAIAPDGAPAQSGSRSTSPASARD